MSKLIMYPVQWGETGAMKSQYGNKTHTRNFV